MAKNNSEDIDFQHYIDAVKQKNIAWNIFIDLMQDLSYRSMNRLRILNAILLTELTTNYSDMDKSKYLNVLLLTIVSPPASTAAHFDIMPRVIMV